VLLHHFSEDPTITRFVPHVPATNPGHAPAVWAIDAEHAALYWFPRDCPRVTVWPGDDAQIDSFRVAFVTTARRVHAIETGWLAAMRSTRLYRYDLDGASFSRWTEAAGQWISFEAVVPVAVRPLGDLIQMHADEGIELRIVPTLWPLHDQVVAGPWEFSIVRMRNATPRIESGIESGIETQPESIEPA
jgi:Family of unknown function (DUF6886)